MTKQLWCWGDIISPELADKALIAEAVRSESRGKRAQSARPAKGQEAEQSTVPA